MIPLGNIPDIKYTKQLVRPLGIGKIKGRCLFDSLDGSAAISGGEITITRVAIKDSVTFEKFEDEIWHGDCDSSGYFESPELVTGFYCVSLYRYYKMLGGLRLIVGQQMAEIIKSKITEITVFVGPPGLEEMPQVY